MSKDLDKVIFDDINLSNILKEIYYNHKNKQTQISVMGIKNDDLLVKMAVLSQKTISSSTQASDNLGISEEERRELLKQAKALNKKSDK
jgi:hypothetical protein